MALPRTITTLGQGAARCQFMGPFLSDGAVYVVVRNAGATTLVMVLKSTDPDTTAFTEQDGANRPTLTNGLSYKWVAQDGTDLHILHQESDGRIGYSLFHMATDLWDGTIVDELVTTAPNGVDGLGGVTVRSDGSVVVVYNGDTDNVHGAKERVDYAVRNGTWTADTEVSNGGGTDWHVGCAVLGDSDRTHIYFKDDTANDAYERTLNSADSLETFPSSFDATAATDSFNIGPGARYDDGGTIRVRAPYADSDGQGNSAKLDSTSDSPTVTVDDPATDNDIDISASAQAVCSMAADGTTLHFLYSDTTTSDIFHDENADDAGWGTDTEELDAVTNDNFVHCNVYVSVATVNSGDVVLAYLYNNGSDINYNERFLRAGAVLQDVIHPQGIIPWAR